MQKNIVQHMIKYADKRGEREVITLRLSKRNISLMSSLAERERERLKLKKIMDYDYHVVEG